MTNYISHWYWIGFMAFQFATLWFIGRIIATLIKTTIKQLIYNITFKQLTYNMTFDIIQLTVTSSGVLLFFFKLLQYYTK